MTSPALVVCGLMMQGLTCSENSFGQLNSCHVLKNHFPCETCLASIGEEQPCYVDRGAPSIYVSTRLGFIGDFVAGFRRGSMSGKSPHKSSLKARGTLFPKHREISVEFSIVFT